MRCDARAVLAAHPGLLLPSLAHHTGPRTAFLRDACGLRLPPPAEYLTLSDSAFCAGPGACQVPRWPTPRPAVHAHVKSVRSDSAFCTGPGACWVPCRLLAGPDDNPLLLCQRDIASPEEQGRGVKPMTMKMQGVSHQPQQQR